MPYLRKYWSRLVYGVLLGILFGFSNAGILGATKVLLDRVFPEPAAHNESHLAKAAGTHFYTGTLRRARESFSAAVDPWLPMAGRSLDIQQALGALVFFPLLFAFRGYAGYLSSYC